MGVESGLPEGLLECSETAVLRDVQNLVGIGRDGNLLFLWARSSLERRGIPVRWSGEGRRGLAFSAFDRNAVELDPQVEVGRQAQFTLKTPTLRLKFVDPFERARCSMDFGPDSAQFYFGLDFDEGSEVIRRVLIGIADSAHEHLDWGGGLEPSGGSNKWEEWVHGVVLSTVLNEFVCLRAEPLSGTGLVERTNLTEESSSPPAAHSFLAS